MGTNIRPKISERNQFYISKHRYYELKHFSMQYPEWKKLHRELDGSPSAVELDRIYVSNGNVSDPTAVIAEARLYFANRIDLVEHAAMEAAGDYYKVLIKAITEGLSYEKLSLFETIPFCKDTWYTIYREYFWILDKTRK